MGRQSQSGAGVKTGGSDQLLLVLSLVIGALVGLAVVAFILLTGRLAARMYPAGGSGWRRILVPVFGSLSDRVSACGATFLSARVQRDSANQVRAVCQRRPHSVSHRGGEIFLLFGVAASGIALDRLRLAVQWTPKFVSVVARNLGLNASQVKSLVPVGCAAALAAAFNTPIAAVLFSLEEIMGICNASVPGSVVLELRYILDGAAPRAGRRTSVSRPRLSAGVHPAEFGGLRGAWCRRRT